MNDSKSSDQLGFMNKLRKDQSAVDNPKYKSRNTLEMKYLNTNATTNNNHRVGLHEIKSAKNATNLKAKRFLDTKLKIANSPKLPGPFMVFSKTRNSSGKPAD